MRSIVLTLCLGLAVTTAVSQTTKKAVSPKKTSTTTAKKAPAAKPTATKKPAPSAKTAVASKKKDPGTSDQNATKNKPAAKSSSTAKSKKPPAKTQAKPVDAATDDKAQFEKASNITDAGEKIAALKKFITAFPNSPLIPQAAELLSATAYSAGDERIGANDAAAAVTFYKLAIDSAPKPVPDTLFSDSLVKIAATLYWRGNRTDGVDLAKELEAKVADNADQLAAMAMFHASIEDGDGAVRVAESATKIGPTSAKAFQTLGLAYRVNFQLDESAAAYAKAVDIDPSSTANKRSLAEIKRALGKSDEAVAMFRDIVTNDPSDTAARNGLVLSLFDAGKKDEAESELSKALEQDSRNVMLLAGAAYWYAANKNADKAIDLAQKAIAVEPRYVWSYIALGRGLMLQNKPLEAEEALLRAKQYGNFPTLAYAIASARCMAGFYRDAVEGLAKDFSIADGTITTRIGQRVERKDASFVGALADERRASILEPAGADDAETAARLKSLLELNAAAAAEKPDEAAAIKAADAFVGSDDKFKLYRGLYAASVLLDKKLATQKAFDYANAAVGGADAALDVPNAGAAVMASELYDSRQIAFARNELVQVPTVPRPMLSAILRGRVEELVGWALMQEDKAAEADIHFRRAVSIYPETSAWWRSAMWRMGSALQAEGKDQDALDAYIKSYSIDKPNLARYTVVEALYKKVNGSTEGLEAKIGRSPIADVSTQEVAKNIEPGEQTNPALPAATPAPTPVPEAAPTPTPSPIATATPMAADPTPTVSTSPSPEATSTPTPTAVAEVTPTPQATPEATPTTQPSDLTASAKPEPSPEVTPTPQVTPVPIATPESTPTPTPDATPSATPQPSATLAESKPEPSPEATSTRVDVKPTPEPTQDAKAEPTPIPTTSSTPAETPQETTTQSTAKANDQQLPKPSPEPTATPSSTPAETSVAKVIISPEPTPTSLTALIGERARVADKPASSTPAGDKQKNLFDPIVITVPKHDASADPAAAAPSRTEGRSRVVEGQPVTSVDLPPCTIRVSQEKVSLLNGGGIASVLIGVDEAGNLQAVRAVSSSPDDVAVELDPDMHAVQGRQLYLIRSLTEKTGMFQVTFQLPCGRKEIAVTVR